MCSTQFSSIYWNILLKVHKKKLEKPKNKTKNNVMSFLIFTKANDLDIWLFFSYFIPFGVFVNNFFNTFIATQSLEPCKNTRK